MLDNFECDNQKDCIGVVGYSFALSSLSMLLHEGSRNAAGVDLQAGVLLDKGGNPLSVGFEFPLYKDVKAMLDAHPDISMVFELSGQAEMVSRLRASLPVEVTLVELPAARFFLKLHATDKLWIACKADLMQTQGLFKSVVDQMPEDILVIGSDGMIMDSNKHCCTKTGESLEELRGKNPLDYYNCLTSVCPVKNGVIDVGAMSGKKQDELMQPETDAEGKMNFYRLYVYPITDELTRKVVQLVVLRRNITERTLIEHRLQQTERMATVGELSAYIAHEIRNPLMAMGGFAKVLLKNKSIDESGHEKIKIIYDESVRLDKLLNSILSFVRSKDVEKSNINVNRVAADAMQQLSLGCQLQEINVELDLDADTPLGVGGAEQVRQCLIHLVKNSMEAMPDGGEIKISSGFSDPYVWLEVRDSGPGIPDEMRTQVFDPFYSSKVNGNGLGLSMVKKIMEEFGGDVELASREDKGTSVALLLPKANPVA
ncbi:two-component system sensor histidine kinase NtrB [Maridesulfovibrio hydrothermalis]|uniref:histidine kinase n=1 Tax=Maridesulfovibrio hydrothermalis AM13 = DSM 14728 TaxID=1121451 RepID=L0RAN5_9BACT|nr:ATP-binding protein [Maridesulfovibrio hydrothermalis]CCO22631.1 PAS/PAC sensor signal transduction histidine kinase [Maridesulfovibrio hydrothermalis AM13 = DSM 14728]